MPKLKQRIAYVLIARYRDGESATVETFSSYEEARTAQAVCAAEQPKLRFVIEEHVR